MSVKPLHMQGALTGKSVSVRAAIMFKIMVMLFHYTYGIHQMAHKSTTQL